MARKIIAILGLPGSGKTEVINYLMEKHGWPKVYFGEVTFDEMKKRGLEINEKNERLVREDIRTKFGKLHYAEKIIEKIQALENGKNILVESLYMWDEYLKFREKFGDNFVTVAVYASPKIRHQRLLNRPERPLSEENSWSRDKAQIEFHNQGEPIAMADYTIINEGDKNFLTNELDKVIKNII
jgi:dephospho-CoA kinase